MPDLRIDYFVTSFMKCLFVFGGYCDGPTSNCFKYICKTGKWIRSLIKGRESAACTVFEGKVVVSGSFNNSGLSSVESYDHHENR